AQLDPLRVPRGIDPGACATEDAHRRTELRERTEALDELRLDPQHPPGVGVQPVRLPAVLQEALIRGGLRHLPRTHEDDTLVVPAIALAVRCNGRDTTRAI